MRSQMETVGVIKENVLSQMLGSTHLNPARATDGTVRLGLRQNWVQIPALPLMGCVALALGSSSFICVVAGKVC